MPLEDSEFDAALNGEEKSDIEVQAVFSDMAGSELADVYYLAATAKNTGNFRNVDISGNTVLVSWHGDKYPSDEELIEAIARYEPKSNQI